MTNINTDRLKKWSPSTDESTECQRAAVVNKNNSSSPGYVPSGNTGTTPQCRGKTLLLAPQCCQRDGA